MDREPLYKLLHDCTVRLSRQGKKEWGTGFFVAPGLILTCAHVIGDDRTTPLVIHPYFRWETAEDVITWNPEKDQGTKVEHITSEFYPDLAVLRTNRTGHPCVLLGREGSAAPRDGLYSWGYSDKYPGGTSLTAEAEGWTRGKDANTVEQTRGRAAENWFLKIKAGQIRKGLSGAPLLNEKTGIVCGIVESTRDAPTDLGGHAVPADVILKQLPFLVEEQRRFHEADPTWDNCARMWARTPKCRLADDLAAALADRVAYCRERNLKFRSPHLLAALLGLQRGFAPTCFEIGRRGYVGELNRMIDTFLARQSRNESERGFEPVVLEEHPVTLAAFTLATSEDAALVDERHLLLAFLDSGAALSERIRSDLSASEYARLRRCVLDHRPGRMNIGPTPNSLLDQSE